MDHPFGIDSFKRVVMHATNLIQSKDNQETDFLNFIWNDRPNRRFLYAALAITAILWSVFKILYPYPNIIFDSYNYIKAAALNWSFNAWPIGYSKVLQVFTFFSHSANLLVGLQYFFVELSCLYFFFTWRFLFRLEKLSYVLFVLLFLNPIFAYCCNYIISDPIFIALSVIWITQLLWLVYRPRPYMIVTNALLIVIAFTIRYNALYYPLVATLAFILSRQRIGLKMAGVTLPVVLMGSFILYTSNKVAKVTGQGQFSAFGSWKIANDALYAYAHILPENIDTVPEKFRALDNKVRQYFRITKDSADLQNSLDFTSGSFYMFSQQSPLVEYMNSMFDKNQWFLNSRKWLIVAPLYQSYGIYLIRKYPAAFARYFCWPNFLRYIIPPGEILGSTVPFKLNKLIEGYAGQYHRKLFSFTTITPSPSSIELSVKLLSFYPPVMAIIHLSFVLGFLGFVACHGFSRIGQPFNYCLLLIVGLWVCDFGFSVLSAGIVLRYQLFMMILEMAAGLYFLEYTYQHLDKKEPINHEILDLRAT